MKKRAFSVNAATAAKKRGGEGGCQCILVHPHEYWGEGGCQYILVHSYEYYLRNLCIYFGMRFCHVPAVARPLFFFLPSSRATVADS